MKIKICSTTPTKYLFDSIQSEELKSYKTNLIVQKFSDGEISPHFEESIRGSHLFIFAETTKNLMELLLTIDCAKRSSAKSITIILPYYGYGRQDKKESHRGGIGASMMAHLLEKYVDRVMSVDLHADQIQGMFNIPFEAIKGHSIFIESVKKLIKNPQTKFCSPDAGGVHRLQKYSEKTGLPYVFLEKERDRPNSIKQMVLIGNVKNYDIILIDDMGDTCGTTKKAAETLLNAGANSVSAIFTHGVLSGNAYKNLWDSPLTNLLISNTLPYYLDLKKLPYNFEVIDCMPVIEQVITNLIKDESISQIME